MVSGTLGDMLLHRLVETSARIAATRSRTSKTNLVAEALREAEEDEVALVTSYLSGRLPQRRTGVGWRTLSGGGWSAAVEPRLHVRDIDARVQSLAELSGTGSSGARRNQLEALMGALTADEQRFVTGLLQGELRQGASDGVMLAATAEAFAVSQADVRRAVMLAGFVGPVAEAARRDGADGLAAIGLRPGRPLRPMLAGSEPTVGEAMNGLAGQAVRVDRKLDGIRIQAHKVGDEIRLFTRSLDEVTERMPEVVDLVRGLPSRTIVLDGEVIALTGDGRPEPFQVTGARTASSGDAVENSRGTPLTVWFFDLLHVDGVDLVDEPLSSRIARLTKVVPEEAVIRAVEVTNPEEAQRFFEDTVAAGHEGVVIKRLDAPYAAGRRGAGWVKVKPRHTLDLVVLAVEQGSGRRRGWLSNIHLGARDPSTGEFVMLGKTFKGMTDEILRWQTARFRELETGDDGWVVTVRPEQVVEIAFDGVQRSTRYPGGVALRFARVVRYRDDKTAHEVDSIEDVCRLLG